MCTCIGIILCEHTYITCIYLVATLKVSPRRKREGHTMLVQVLVVPTVCNYGFLRKLITTAYSQFSRAHHVEKRERRRCACPVHILCTYVYVNSTGSCLWLTPRPRVVNPPAQAMYRHMHATRCHARVWLRQTNSRLESDDCT